MKILPHAAEPFTLPTDRDMLPSERREFVHTQSHLRLRHTTPQRRPGMWIVDYVPTDTDELLVSTTCDRSKAGPSPVSRGGVVHPLHVRR